MVLGVLVKIRWPHCSGPLMRMTRHGGSICGVKSHLHHESGSRKRLRAKSLTSLKGQAPSDPRTSHRDPPRSSTHLGNKIFNPGVLYSPHRSPWCSIGQGHLHYCRVSLVLSSNYLEIPRAEDDQEGKSKLRICHIKDQFSQP